MFTKKPSDTCTASIRKHIKLNVVFSLLTKVKKNYLYIYSAFYIMERPCDIVFLRCTIFFYSVHTHIMYNKVHLHHLFDYTEWFSYLLQPCILLKNAKKYYF